MRRRIAIAGFAAAICALIGSAELSWAATYTWNANTAGSPVDGAGTWDLVSTDWWNGSANAAWNNANVALFGATAGTNSYSATLGQTTSASGLVFSNQSYTIDGGTDSNSLVIGSAGLVANFSGQFTAPLVLSASQTWTATAGQTLTIGEGVSGVFNLTLGGAGVGSSIAGPIATGSASLTKSGAGTWILLGSNSYTGITKVSAGVLQVNSAFAGLGDSTAANAVNLTGGTLSLLNDGTGNGGTIIYRSADNPNGYNVTATNATIAVGNAASSWANTIQLGALSQGNGSLVVTGANDYGLSFVGTTTITNSNAKFAPSGASLTLANVAGNVSFTLDGTPGGNLITGSIATGAHAVTKSNSSTWTLGGTSSYTGGTTISGGILQVNVPLNGLGDSTAANAINLIGGVLSLLNDGSGNNGTIVYCSASNPTGYNVTATNATINVGALRSSTGNTVQLGALVESGGTLNVTGGNGYSLSFAGATTLASSVDLDPLSANLKLASVTGSFPFTLDGATSGNTITGPITIGTGALSKTNLGTWTLAASSSYTGATTVNGGLLKGTASTGTPFGTGNVVLTGGTLQVAPATSGPNAITAAGASASTTFSYVGGSTLQLTKDGSGLTFTVGNTSPSGSVLTHTGSGTLIIAPTALANLGSSEQLIVNGLTSAADINGIYGAVMNFGGAGAQVTWGSGSFVPNGRVLTLGAAAANSVVDFQNPVNLGGAARNVNVVSTTQAALGSYDADFSGLLSGAGGLTTTGNGVLALLAGNTYTGVTAVSSGTLQIDDGVTGAGWISGNVVNNSTLIFNRADIGITFPGTISGTGGLVQLGGQGGGGTLVLTGSNSYTGGTTIAANSTLQIDDGSTGTGWIVGNVLTSGTLAFNRADVVTFPGAVSGSGALVQQGGGVLILTGSSTYSGGTSVTAGTLQLGNGGATGWVPGDIALSNGGVLAFSRADNLVYNIVVSDDGSGTLLQLGPGKLILTNTSTVGTAAVSGGTMQIGNGGTAGMVITQNIQLATSGAVAFHHADNLTYAGTVYDDGTGVFAQFGPGMLKLWLQRHDGRYRRHSSVRRQHGVSRGQRRESICRDTE